MILCSKYVGDKTK